MPSLPGAQNTCATCGEAASVTACAISRPPPPTTRTFAMGSLMGVAGAEDSVQVPGSTHGILGLVEHALAHQEEASLTGPIAVHCRSVPRQCLTH